MNDERFYDGPVDHDARRSAPAALRNIAPIGEVLGEWLPEHGTVLELASGTGEHALAYARRFARLMWQPSDCHPDALKSIAAWRAVAGLANLSAPVAIDAGSDSWPITHADALVAFNMIHISPWRSTLGMIKGARRLLPRDAPLILYGPWFERGVAAEPSNAAFDADLKRRNPHWGVRVVEEFAEAAAARGLILTERRVMPANNLMLLLRRD